MLNMIEFIKGNSVKGSIMQLGDKEFLACTATQSKQYKTERGARKFMDKNGYREVQEVKIDTVGEVVEVVELVETEVIVDTVEFGEMKIVALNDNLSNMPVEVKDWANLPYLINKYRDRLYNYDKFDLMEDLNHLFIRNNVNIMVIDDDYRVDKNISFNDFKVGSRVSYKTEKKADTTLIAMYYHTYQKKYVGLFSNGTASFLYSEYFEVVTEENKEGNKRIVIASDTGVGFTNSYAYKVLDMFREDILGSRILIRLITDTIKVIEVNNIENLNLVGTNSRHHLRYIKEIIINYDEDDLI